MKVEEFGGGTFSPAEQELILQDIADGVMEGIGRGKITSQLRTTLANKLKGGALIDIKGISNKFNWYS